MGDFDRFEKPSHANESKKLVMVVGLGAALLALVGFQFVKHGPQSASAAVTPDADITPTVSETPAALRQALAVNPTADLLRSDASVQVAPKPMRNPFRMGSAWLASLHSEQVKPSADDNAKPQPRPVSFEPVVPQVVRAEDYKLSIIVSGPSMSAIINGKLAHVGDVIGKARILKITGEEVTLQHADFSDGPTTILSLQRH